MNAPRWVRRLTGRPRDRDDTSCDWCTLPCNPYTGPSVELRGPCVCKTRCDGWWCQVTRARSANFEHTHRVTADSDILFDATRKVLRRDRPR